jgi:hypothetical protein
MEVRALQHVHAALAATVKTDDICETGVRSINITTLPRAKRRPGKYDINYF